MGMLINGNWSSNDTYITDGTYNRPKSSFTVVENAKELIQSLIQNDNSDTSRYWLIGSDSCPWSQRCFISYHLFDLSAQFNIHIAHGERVEGYALNNGAIWQPDLNFSAIHLHELYTETMSDYTGRVTVPVLWDNLERKILCNESSEIIRFFDQLARSMGKISNFTLYPDKFADEIDFLNREIHNKLSNGVYKAGFAQSQSAYDEAVTNVFEMMSMLDNRMADREYLFGSAICISDINLFSTLIRFDVVYHILHRCSLKRLVDYPNLWDYAKRLYQLNAFKNTVNFEVIKQASYQNDTDNNPHGIIPTTCEVMWTQ